MKEFSSLDKAFEYFHKEMYPKLERGRASQIKNIMYYYSSGVRGVSDQKKTEILEKYANAKIEKSLKIFI